MCFGGGNSSQTNTYSLPPPYIQEAQKNIIDMGQQLVNQPMQVYGGPTVAGFTPGQNQAFNTINNAQGMAMPYYNAAAQYYGNATAPLGANVPGVNAQTIGSFESPYMNDVMRSTMANINEGNQQQQQSLAGNAISKGAWGGDRAGVAQGELARQQGLASGQVYAGLENQNYAQALAAAQQQQGVGLQTAAQQAALNMQGGQNMASLGTTAENNALAGAGAQLTAGNQQQAQAQNELNSEMQQFQQSQMAPYQQLQFLQGLTNPTAQTAGGSSQTSQPAPNQSSQMMGTIMQLAPLIMAAFAKDGGAITGRAAGGAMPAMHHGHHASMPHPHATVMPSARGSRMPAMGMPHMGLGMPKMFSGQMGLAAGGAAQSDAMSPDPIFGPMTSMPGAGGVDIPQITSGGGANEQLSTTPVSNFTPPLPSQWQSTPSPFKTPTVDWSNFYTAKALPDTPLGPKKPNFLDTALSFAFFGGLPVFGGTATPFNSQPFDFGSVHQHRDAGGALSPEDVFSVADDTMPNPLAFSLGDVQMPQTGMPMPSQARIPMNAAQLAAAAQQQQQAQAQQQSQQQPQQSPMQGMAPAMAAPQDTTSQAAVPGASAMPPATGFKGAMQKFGDVMQKTLGPGWQQAMMSAGAGMMAGTSPNAMVNIGHGMQEGIQTAQQQQQMAAQVDYAKAMERYRMEMADARQRSVDDMATRLSQQADKAAKDQEFRDKHEIDQTAHNNRMEDIAAQNAGAGKFQMVPGEGLDPASGKQVPGAYIFNQKTGVPEFHAGMVPTAHTQIPSPKPTANEALVRAAADYNSTFIDPITGAAKDPTKPLPDRASWQTAQAKKYAGADLSQPGGNAPAAAHTVPQRPPNLPPDAKFSPSQGKWWWQANGVWTHN